MAEAFSGNSVFVKQVTPGCYSLTGTITLDNAEAAYWQGVNIFNSPNCLVDCKGLDNSDSAALSLIAKWIRWANTKGTTLQFQNFPRTTLDLMELYGVKTLFPIADSV